MSENIEETRVRCAWLGTDPLYVAYHDTEWGVPVHDDARLFELLTLEGAQAGLSWFTILKRREGYREAFFHFDPARVATFTTEDVEQRVADPGIIRHRGKIESTVTNAQAFLTVQKEFGSFDAYVWRFVGGSPVQNHFADIQTLPAQTAVSVALSRDLRKRGFRFVGPTTCYAFMQAVGMVNDHTADCFRYEEVKHLAD